MTSSHDEETNIRAAMDKVAETINPTVSGISKQDDGPADKQVLIRTTDFERDRWKMASNNEQITLSAWIRDTLNNEAKRILECNHPAPDVIFYPWAHLCKKCGQRIWEK
jgi:hypothetical protein